MGRHDQRPAGCIASAVACNHRAHHPGEQAMRAMHSTLTVRRSPGARGEPVFACPARCERSDRHICTPLGDRVLLRERPRGTRPVQSPVDQWQQRSLTRWLPLPCRQMQRQISLPRWPRRSRTMPSASSCSRGTPSANRSAWRQQGPRTRRYPLCCPMGPSRRGSRARPRPWRLRRASARA